MVQQAAAPRARILPSVGRGSPAALAADAKGSHMSEVISRRTAIVSIQRALFGAALLAAAAWPLARAQPAAIDPPR